MNPEHDALEQEIARASITVVKSAPNEGYRLRQGEMLALVSAHHSLPRLAGEIRRHEPDVLVVQLHPALPDKQVREALQKVASAQQCLVATSPPEPWSDAPIDQTKQMELVKALHQQFGERLVVVALREPYDIRR